MHSFSHTAVKPRTLFHFFIKPFVIEICDSFVSLNIFAEHILHGEYQTSFLVNAEYHIFLAE